MAFSMHFSPRAAGRRRQARRLRRLPVGGPPLGALFFTKWIKINGRTSKIDCFLLAGIINHCSYRPDGRDLRVRLANVHLEGCRNTSTSGGNDLVHTSWHPLQNRFAAEMSKIDWFLLADIINRCPYRPDRRDLRVRLADVHLEGCRNTSTSGGNDLVCSSWHTLHNPFAAEISKIDYSVLANDYNHYPYRTDGRDLRVRLAKLDMGECRNTSTSGGNDLVRRSWHTL